jgi:hypothetical protein
MSLSIRILVRFTHLDQDARLISCRGASSLSWPAPDAHCPRRCITTTLTKDDMRAIACSAPAQGFPTGRCAQRNAFEIDRSATRPIFDSARITGQVHMGLSKSPTAVDKTARNALWPGCCAIRL